MPADFLEKLPVLWAARDSFNWQALLIAALTIAVIVGLRRVSPRIPGSIIAVALGSALIVQFGWPVDTIASRFGNCPAVFQCMRCPKSHSTG